MAGMRATSEIETELGERREALTGAIAAEEAADVAQRMWRADGAWLNAAAPPPRHAPKSPHLRSTIAMLEGHLERARKRDEIQAGRAEHCWCVGYGSCRGKGREPEWCPCDDGAAARARWHAEKKAVEDRRDAELWAQAGVPARFELCTVENFPINDRIREGYERAVAWLGPYGEEADAEAEERWAALKESILLWGPFGTGKTGLATGLMRARMLGDRALFLTVPTLLDRIRATYDGKGSESERELLTTVQTIPLLLLDDLGAERVTEWVAEKLFTVINARHDDMLTTIFTSNLDPRQLAGHVGERTAWRIVEMCEVVKLDGPNLRDKR